ncbi:MAG: EAL domain-containing protein, partial [Deltaproteobacteria bacterium]|nr:EAL domain-containing protein [Deltaproteobacteria bacterium]
MSSSTDQDRIIEVKLLRARSVTAYAVIQAPGGRALLQPLKAENAKGGLTVRIPRGTQQPIAVIARIDPLWTSAPKARLWNATAFDRSVDVFDRAGGAFFGAFLIIAAFSAIIAVRNRDLTFLFFSIWLVTTLRLVAINGGWDPVWLNLPISGEAASVILRTSLALHALVTALLFRSLFSESLPQRWDTKALSLIVYVLAAISAASIFTEHEATLQMIWTAGGLGLILLLKLLWRLIGTTPTNVVKAYAFSWICLIFGMLGDISYAAGFIDLPVSASSIGACLSAFVMATAMAEKIRAERDDRIRAQANEVDALQRFRTNYTTVPIGLCTLAPDGRVIDFNPAFESLVEQENNLLYSSHCTWDMLFGGGSFSSIWKGLEKSKQIEIEIAADIRGKKRWFKMRAVLKAEKVEGSVEDITQRKEADFQLRFLAHHDPLTSLLNRRGFDTRFERAMSQVAQGESALLAYVDLDRFKLVNDLFGHVAGDNVLRQVADRLKARVQEPHSIARVGGDEFLILFVGMQPLDAKALCEEILDDIRTSPYQFQDKAFSVDASLGLTPLERNMSERDAISTCDRACSEAKRLGGAHVVLLNDKSEQVKQHLDEIRLIAEIRNSLPEDRLFTVFQPIVSLREPASSLCYEVLLRMRDDDGKTIPPGRFIAAAERNGLMTRIDRFVLTNTLEWLDRHPEHREHLSFTTLNISGASLNDERFIEDVRAIVREHPQSAPKLCFEITESVALYDLNGTRRFVDMIKAFGAMIALDDFGAGYTSFSYLKELRGDIVKIDGGFIRDINSNPANYAITRAIIDVSHEL